LLDPEEPELELVSGGLGVYAGVLEVSVPVVVRGAPVPVWREDAR
jgi:hypothetical protein